MAVGTMGGLLVVSLDVDGPEGHGPEGRGPGEGGPKGPDARLEDATRRLLALLQRCHIPATFALSHPGASKLTAAILGSRLGHEIAILGDSSWVGPQAGRTRFARELTWRVRLGNEAGVPIASLALRDGTLEDHLDLLVKNRIAAIREATVAVQNSPRLIRPQLFRYGIWRAAASCRLPSSGRLKKAEASAHEAVKRAALDDEIVHLSIDVPQLLNEEQTTLTVLERVLVRAHQYRQEGRLIACTLAAAVGELSRIETVRRARSVLRAA